MDTIPRAGKRGRSDSLSSTSSASSTRSIASSSRSLSPVNKILRSTSTAHNVFECSLPPTCIPTSQKFDSISELERHQLAFHTYICRTPVRDKNTSPEAEDPTVVPKEFTSRKRNEWKECRKIFPDQRILDLVSLLMTRLSLLLPLCRDVGPAQSRRGYQSRTRVTDLQHQAETHDPSRHKQHEGVKIVSHPFFRPISQPDKPV